MNGRMLASCHAILFFTRVLNLSTPFFAIFKFKIWILCRYLLRKEILGN
jgi:hypothetical protein